MSNTYFDETTVVISNNTRADADDVNGVATATEAGFGLLPEPDELVEGSADVHTQGGAADVYTFTIAKNWSAYAVGQKIRFKVVDTNTGAATVNVNGIGAVAITYVDGTALAAGALTAGQMATLECDGSKFVFNAQSSDSSAASAAISASEAAASAASLPTISSGDAAKLLQVNATEDGYDFIPYRNWLPFSIKEGMLISKPTSDPDEFFDIATGSIMDTTDTYLMTLGSAFSKRIATSGVAETFAVGTGLGGLSDDDVLAADTWYGVFLLSKSTDPTDCDIIYATTLAKSLSDAVATAAGFDISRLIGYGHTDSSEDLEYIVDNGKGETIFQAPEQVVHAGVIAGAAVVVNCPPFQRANLIYAGVGPSSTMYYGRLHSVNQSASAVGSSNFDIAIDGDGASHNGTSSVFRSIKVDASSQVWHRETITTSIWSIRSEGYDMDYTITDLV